MIYVTYDMSVHADRINSIPDFNKNIISLEDKDLTTGSSLLGKQMNVAYVFNIPKSLKLLLDETSDIYLICDINIINNLLRKLNTVKINYILLKTEDKDYLPQVVKLFRTTNSKAKHILKQYDNDIYRIFKDYSTLSEKLYYKTYIAKPVYRSCNYNTVLRYLVNDTQVSTKDVVKTLSTYSNGFSHLRKFLLDNINDYLDLLLNQNILSEDFDKYDKINPYLMASTLSAEGLMLLVIDIENSKTTLDILNLRRWRDRC